MRPQDQIDHIRKFKCDWCGADIGDPCLQSSRSTFEGFVRMRDFHLARTRAAYPDAPIDRTTNTNTPKDPKRE